MWNLEVEENEKRCEAVGPPVGWRVVCHNCGHRFPIMPGAPFTGGASALKCCANPNRHAHDLRVPCDYCKDK